ncbi:MAG: type II toxin-antitoxin system RelE/ParE family toxin [Bifidobacteriaceae bacterium]|nr:type II toxin-antitoxin system RelE/ParE family toxin [Bifidobacteriaceae bacterium]
MSQYRVKWSDEALGHLDALWDHVPDAGSPLSADRFTEAIVARCQRLADFPYLGKARGDIRPGLRILGYKKRITIAFTVLDNGTVAIAGIFYAGCDWQTILADND